MSKFKPGTVQKDLSSSTIGLPAGIEPTVRFFDAGAML